MIVSLGVISPVTILYKMLCQQLCEAKIGWDEPLLVSLTRLSHSQERVWYVTVQLIVLAAECTRGRAVRKPHTRLGGSTPRKSWGLEQTVAL